MEYASSLVMYSIYSENLKTFLLSKGVIEATGAIQEVEYKPGF